MLKYPTYHDMFQAATRLLQLITVTTQVISRCGGVRPPGGSWKVIVQSTVGLEEEARLELRIAYQARSACVRNQDIPV